MLRVVILRAVVLNVANNPIIPSAIMPNAIMLSVVAPSLEVPYHDSNHNDFISFLKLGHPIIISIVNLFWLMFWNFIALAQKVFFPIRVGFTRDVKLTCL